MVVARGEAVVVDLLVGVGGVGAEGNLVRTAGSRVPGAASVAQAVTAVAVDVGAVAAEVGLRGEMPAAGAGVVEAEVGGPEVLADGHDALVVGADDRGQRSRTGRYGHESADSQGSHLILPKSSSQSRRGVWISSPYALHEEVQWGGVHKLNTMILGPLTALFMIYSWEW